MPAYIPIRTSSTFSAMWPLVSCLNLFGSSRFSQTDEEAAGEMNNKLASCLFLVCRGDEEELIEGSHLKEKALYISTVINEVHKHRHT